MSPAAVGYLHTVVCEEIAQEVVGGFSVQLGGLGVIGVIRSHTSERIPVADVVFCSSSVLAEEVVRCVPPTYLLQARWRNAVRKVLKDRPNKMPLLRYLATVRLKALGIVLRDKCSSEVAYAASTAERTTGMPKVFPYHKSEIRK